MAENGLDGAYPNPVTDQRRHAGVQRMATLVSMHSSPQWVELWRLLEATQRPITAGCPFLSWIAVTRPPITTPLSVFLSLPHPPLPYWLLHTPHCPLQLGYSHRP